MTDQVKQTSQRLYPKLRAFLHWPDDQPLDHCVDTSDEPNLIGPNRPIRVRPSAPKRAPPEAKPPLVLGDAARAALLFQPEPGRTTFDIALDEQLLGNVRCRISLGPEGIDATFVVTHSTERWLLDAEVPRLRALLESKGLTVRSVSVMDAEDADAPALLT